MNLKELKLKANDIRKDIINMLNKAGSGHSAGAIGLADIFCALYFDILKHDPKKPNDPARDFVILSNGHVCPVLYSSLAQSGYFTKNRLDTLRKIGSKLQGHPHNLALEGVENSSGPLGQGFSQAAGLAAALKRDKKPNHVFCFVGDGELNEGQVWEATLFAGKERLDNLITIVDRNHIQIDGNTEDVMPLEPLNEKFLAFNWAVISIDGNDIRQVKHALREAKNIWGKPVCILANTIPGKNISFMEGDFNWHGKAPNDEESVLALNELNSIEKKILGGEL